MGKRALLAWGRWSLTLITHTPKAMIAGNAAIPSVIRQPSTSALGAADAEAMAAPAMIPVVNKPIKVPALWG